MTRKNTLGTLYPQIQVAWPGFCLKMKGKRSSWKKICFVFANGFNMLVTEKTKLASGIFTQPVHEIWFSF